MNSPVEKTEPVACIIKGDGWGEELMFSPNEAAERAKKLSEYFRLTIEPLYSVSTVEALKAENAALLSRVERQAVAIDALEEWAGILRASTGSVELPTGDDRDPSDIYADVRKKIDATLQETKP